MSGETHRQRLENLTPAQRALLEQRLIERRAAAARRAAITRREVESPCELSYAQELLWLLSQVFDDGVAYNAPGAFHLEGQLDLELLGRALDGLVKRHEILRTTYTVIDGVPKQVVGPTAPWSLNVVDLRQWPEETREAEAQRILKEESRFAFDLVNGPVLRPTVIRLGDREHILMLVLHHVATDGWSRAVLYRDLTTLYEAHANGVAADLPPLSIQYADYAVWQRRWLDSGVGDAQLDYWKRKLARAPSRLDLPADFPRPPVRSYVGEQVSMMLDIETREGLRHAARRHDGTLFVALLSIFATLLSRYAGQEDIVIGTPFAGRNRSELESMVGYFINPLALRVDLSGDPSFDELLVRARDTVLDAFAHADVPYETVVRATNPERDLSQTPVFQAMIVFHNPSWQTQRPKFQPEGIRCTEITHEKGWSKFDVLVGMSERSTGLNTTWEYSTELFKRSTLLRMMEHFRALAASAAVSPERPLSRLTMLSEGERARLVVSFNAGRDALPDGESMKELIEAQVARTPDRTAVVFADERLTFDELNRRANRIAALLGAHGVGPGTLVGVLMEKSIDLVPAVIGVMKAGGAYIPLDPLYPPDRIEFMLSDAKPSVLLTHEKHVGALPAEHGTVLALDAAGALESLPDTDPPTIAKGDDLAYIIYTSGSTGSPKGAMIANRSLVSAQHAYARAYRLGELTAHLQMASFSFDVFTGDLIRSLPVGAKLVLCPIEVVVDPPRLYEVMQREQIDAAEFVPATASLLFEHLEREGRTLDFMRLVVVSSEAWRNEKYRFFKSLCGPNTRLVNAYGLTEATIDSTWFEPDEDTELVPGRFVPIGGPLDNTSVYVLDSRLEPQPIGIPGELCVGGVAVARGYLNRPELNAEKFVPDPFSDVPGALLYRTGDLARWLEDGTIDFLGRTDRQLKVRGFRIEPGEIEAVLESHAGVRAAAVTVREDEASSARLVAYLTPADSDALPHFDELRTLVANRLPAYMIPAAWVLVDPLPLTPNGKVDFDALPDPEFDRSATAGEFIAPRTETERALAAVWSEVLGIDDVGVTDNFFELGGHSLLAVRLFAEIERTLGVRLPLASLFQGATIEAMAQMIGDSESSADETWPSIVLLKEGDEERHPFFIVGWVDGELIGYRELAAHWSGQPLYGLLAPGVDGRTLPRDTIEGIASYYIDEIRRFQPHGPYYIGGFCFSGLVAYEIGRQLAEQGERLGSVALIDAYWHGSRRKPTRAQIEREKFSELKQADMRGRVTWLRNRAVRLKNRVRTEIYFKSGYFTLDLLARLRRGQLPTRRWNMVTVAGARAAKRYKPIPADVRIDFFRAQTEPTDEATVWDGLARRGVALHQVVGPEMSHVTICKEPGVRRLAAAMARVLDESLDSGAIANGRSSADGHGGANGRRASVGEIQVTSSPAGNLLDAKDGSAANGESPSLAPGIDARSE
jgi:amino acid adenylation domain-containing protein